MLIFVGVAILLKIHDVLGVQVVPLGQRNGSRSSCGGCWVFRLSRETTFSSPAHMFLTKLCIFSWETHSSGEFLQPIGRDFFAPPERYIIQYSYMPCNHPKINMAPEKIMAFSGFPSSSLSFRFQKIHVFHGLPVGARTERPRLGLGGCPSTGVAHGTRESGMPFENQGKMIIFERINGWK